MLESRPSRYQKNGSTRTSVDDFSHGPLWTLRTGNDRGGPAKTSDGRPAAIASGNKLLDLPIPVEDDLVALYAGEIISEPPTPEFEAKTFQWRDMARAANKRIVELSRVSVLSRSERRELKNCRRTILKSAKIQERFLLQNRRLVVRILPRFWGQGPEDGELLHAGDMALLNSIRLFDPSQGAFANYAGVAIIQEMTKVGRRYWRDQTVPNSRLKRNDPSLSYDDRVLSLEKLVEAEENDENSFQLSDPNSSVEQAFERRELSERLHAVLGKLAPRDAFVIQLFFGTTEYGEYTLDEIGAMIGSTNRERPRQLKERGLAMLRELLGDVK